MINPVRTPRIVALGLGLELYSRTIPGFMERLEGMLHRFVGEIRPHAEVLATRLCYVREHVECGVEEAHRGGADAIVLVPVCYTASGMTLAPILRTPLPVVVWNTQEMKAIGAGFSFDDLLMNHVAQGTQDVANVLLRSGKVFGMESGHFEDAGAIERLAGWLRAARAAESARQMRVGLMGQPFEDMGDFGVDCTAMLARWGPQVVQLGVPRLAELAGAADRGEIAAMVEEDRRTYDVAPDVTPAIHEESARLEWAMRKIVHESRIDALTMNFRDVMADGRVPTMPFLGINKLMGEGLGYAGEGDVVTAAHVAEMRQLCGEANFTEIFTADFDARRLLMLHMQECNPALARRDRKVRLIRKDFWAPGVRPYVGMYFTVEPGPVTLVCCTTDREGRFCYIVHETTAADMAPLEKLDVPHWMVQLDAPAGDFLTSYSLAGGTHHLAAMPGRCAWLVERLAQLQGFAVRGI